MSRLPVGALCVTIVGEQGNHRGNPSPGAPETWSDRQNRAKKYVQEKHSYLLVDHIGTIAMVLDVISVNSVDQLRNKDL